MSMLFHPNTRFFIKDNINLWGRIKSAHAVHYDIIEMGTRESPFFKNPPSVCVILNGERYPCNTITLKTLESLEGFQVRDEFDRSWQRAVKVYARSGCTFWVITNSIVYFKLWCDIDFSTQKEILPKIGVEDCSHMFSLPLSDEEAEKLFGEPDKIQDVFIQ